MALKFSYDSDPEIRPVIVPFNAVVDACQVSRIEVPQDFAVMYTVAEPEIKIQLRATQSPDCGFAINYSGAVVETGGGFPEFIILDPQAGELTVFSD